MNPCGILAAGTTRSTMCLSTTAPHTTVLPRASARPATTARRSRLRIDPLLRIGRRRRTRHRALRNRRRELKAMRCGLNRRLRRCRIMGRMLAAPRRSSTQTARRRCPDDVNPNGATTLSITTCPFCTGCRDVESVLGVTGPRRVERQPTARYQQTQATVIARSTNRRSTRLEQDSSARYVRVTH